MPAKNDFASPNTTIHNVPGAIGSATVLGINDAGQVVGNIFNGAGNVIGQEATASWTLAELGVQSSNASAARTATFLFFEVHQSDEVQNSRARARMDCENEYTFLLTRHKRRPASSYPQGTSHRALPASTFFNRPSLIFDRFAVSDDSPTSSGSLTSVSRPSPSASCEREAQRKGDRI